MLLINLDSVQENKFEEQRNSAQICLYLIVPSFRIPYMPVCGEKLVPYSAVLTVAAQLKLTIEIKHSNCGNIGLYSKLFFLLSSVFICFLNSDINSF